MKSNLTLESSIPAIRGLLTTRLLSERGIKIEARKTREKRKQAAQEHEVLP